MTDKPYSNVGGIIPYNPYAFRRRRRGERQSDIYDPAIRSRCISLASTGVSRRTVAHLLGKPESTVRGWVERGLAYPNIEPWGSFAEDYMRAERGLAGAIGDTVAMKVQHLNERMKRVMEWAPFDEPQPTPPVRPRKPAKGSSLEARIEHARAELEYQDQAEAWEKARSEWTVRKEKHEQAQPAVPDVQDMVWLEKLRISRHPQDYGTSKHRQPEPDHDGSHWLDTHAMDREQLAALLCDPPDVLADAINDAARSLYARIMAGGFDPASPAPVEIELDE